MKQTCQSPVRQMQGDQSVPIDTGDFRVLSYRDDIDRLKVVAPVKRDVFRIVYPQSIIILARNVVKAAWSAW